MKTFSVTFSTSVMFSSADGSDQMQFTKNYKSESDENGLALIIQKQLRENDWLQHVTGSWFKTSIVTDFSVREVS